MKSGGERVGNEKQSVAVGHRELQYSTETRQPENHSFIYLFSDRLVYIPGWLQIPSAPRDDFGVPRSRLLFFSARIIGVRYHIRFMRCWASNPGLHVSKASPLPTEPHPQLQQGIL